MIIQHNLPAANIARQLQSTDKALRKTTGKLSSGYRINSAADDAANTQISEKMRSQIRGLMRSVRNAEEGVGFVQTGDGGMSEISGLMQRMRELCVQSLNDTYTDQDRAAMQMEFDHLQSEIDKINDETEYNTLSVFEHYSDTYYLFEGNRYWTQDQLHQITDANNSLTIRYQISADEPEKEITITVPNGVYTTQELMDEIDDVVTELGENADGLYLEYTRDGRCNMALQDGEEITSVSGGLSYLFYGEYGGAEVGIVLGTTEFVEGGALKITEENNELIFIYEKYDGTEVPVEITIDSGLYSRKGIIKVLNEKIAEEMAKNPALAGCDLKASEYGEYNVKLGGSDGIVTGLKGNMFRIDDKGAVYNSIFYDNTHYGNVEKTEGNFYGDYVLPEKDTVHIDDTNRLLRMKVNDTTEDYVEVLLDKGDYTAFQLQQQLKDKFKEKGFELNVALQSETRTTPYGNTLTFYRFQLQSLVSGKHSKIEFDIPGSTAYNTLFVDRRYTDVGKEPKFDKGLNKRTDASQLGGKSFQAEDFPLTLDDTDHTFCLKVTEQAAPGSSKTADNYTVSLPEKSYASLSELISAIDAALNGAGAPSGIKGKLTVKAVDGKIQIQSAETNTTVMKIEFVTSGNNGAGYKKLFVGESVSYSDVPVSNTDKKPQITLDQIDEPVTFNEKNNKFTVNVGGESKEVTIPPGVPYSRDQLAEGITKQLKGKTDTQPKRYRGEGTGKTTLNQQPYDRKGSESQIGGKIDCNKWGSGETLEGTDKPALDATPAKYTFPSPLKNKTVVTEDSNCLRITIGNTAYTIFLDKGEYSPKELAEELNRRMQEELTGDLDKVKVSLDAKNRLVFETEFRGSDAHMSFSEDTSSLLKEINTERKPAEFTTKSLQKNIEIGADSNQFTMSVDGKTYTVTLDSGSYKPQELAEELNKKLAAKGAGVTVELSNGSALKFTTKAEGTKASLEFNTETGGSSMEALFGELETKTPASATIDTPVQQSVEIKDGENTFTVQLTVGGKEKKITRNIPAGTYDRDGLCKKLQELFQDDLDIKIDSSGKLTFTSKAKGGDVSIKVDNQIGGSAGTAIFGEDTITVPDVTASFDQNGQLQLSGSQSSSSYTLSVTPEDDSVFLKPKKVVKEILPKRTDGALETKKYTLTTQCPVPKNLEVTSENNKLHFLYSTPSGEKTVDITLDEREYTPAELQAALQGKLDAVLGTGAINVAVGTNISLTASEYGEDYEIKSDSLSGGFYDKVMRGTTEREEKGTPSKVDGADIITDTYIIGRKDIRNHISNIVAPRNRFTIDVTIAGKVTKLDIEITPGKYNCQALLKELQEKIDAEVKDKGLPEKCILVGVGKYDTGVVGANDSNALDIYLNKDLDNLVMGEYRIDGLTGDALFEIFYRTEGELTPAYLDGTKDISRGVQIKEGENELSFEVDGTVYEYTIPTGNYSQEEIIQKLNDLFHAPDNNGNMAYIEAGMTGNALRISHQKLGKHSIKEVQGSAKPAIFQSIQSRQNYDSDLHLQIGANARQGMELNRYSMSTLNMGINSLSVSRTKYAKKALGRMDAAIDYLDERRSSYGAKQNRLGHVMDGNENTAENLQATESKIRDADMADEMADFARRQILQQAGNAMLAQTNQRKQSIMTLLR